jgi:FMN reductase
MSRRSIAVVAAGLRQPSSTRLLADRLGEATVRILGGTGVDVDVTVVELRDHAHDLTNHLLTGFPSAELRATIDTVRKADGLIAVTPIFTASYSGLFKSFFDVLDADVLAGKPVLIGATGGTERHSLALDYALRPLFAYLRAVVVPTAVYAATSDWGDDGESGGLARRIDRSAGEFAALVAAATAQDTADPFADFTPFDELLLDE